jgi:hypothetical protein
MSLHLLELVIESHFEVALQGSHLRHILAQRPLVPTIFCHRSPSFYRPASLAGASLSTVNDDATGPSPAHLRKPYSPECVEEAFSEIERV